MDLRFPSLRILAGFLVVLTITILIVAFRNRECRGCTDPFPNNQSGKSSEKTPWRPPAAHDIDPPGCDIRDSEFELRWISGNETNSGSVAELVLENTLVVDGCLLDCNAVKLTGRSGNATKLDAITRKYQFKISGFSRTPGSDDPSIVAVRNGGVVRSCRMGLRLIEDSYTSKKEQPVTSMKMNELYDRDEDAIQELHDEIHEELGTLLDQNMKDCVSLSPDVVVPDAETVLEDRDAKLGSGTLVYETMPVTGVRCDEGDCHLVGVDCIDYRGITKHCNTRENRNADIVPLLGSCLVAKTGAGDVRIRGSYLSNTVAATGLFVNATTEEEVAVEVGWGSGEEYSVFGLLANITTTEHYDITPMRLFVDNTTIANQLRDGISVFGGDAIKTIRIADTHLEGNGRDGIRLSPYWIPGEEESPEYSTYLGTGGLENLAILRGSVRNNGIDGIHLSWTDEWRKDVYPATIKTNTTIFVSGTDVGENQRHGLWVERGTRSGDLDIAIVGAVFDGNFHGKRWVYGASVGLKGNINNIDIRHVVSKNSPAGTGLRIDTVNSTIAIQDSVVVLNGFRNTNKYDWVQTGIVLWGAWRANLTNVAITHNGRDGLFVSDLRDLYLQGVDSTDNHGDGIYIWDSRTKVYLTDVRTCRNTRHGIFFDLYFDTESEGCDNKTISGNEIVSCGNGGSLVGDSCPDYVDRGDSFPTPSPSAKHYDSRPKLQDYDSYIEYYKAYLEYMYMESRNSTHASVTEDSQAVRIDNDNVLCSTDFQEPTCKVVGTNCTKGDCRGHRVILAADGTAMEDHYEHQITTSNLTV